MSGNVADLWWGLALVGIAAGVFSGMLGLGSGTLLVPALVLLFGLPQKSAQGTALAVMVPMVLVGAIRYKLNPEIDIRAWSVALLALGAVTGALVGTELAARLPAHVLRRVLAILLVVAAAKMLLTRPRPDPPVSAGTATEQTAAVSQMIGVLDSESDR